MALSKSRLAIELSRLEVFESPDTNKEQYPTDSEIAADMLWNAYYLDDIEGKIIADFGAGTGILGIGALLLDAKKVYFVEKDKEALEIAKRNLDRFNIEGEAIFLNKDIEMFNEKVDTIIQNPPFGTREKHTDRTFLIKAFEIAKTIYSFHKETSKAFIKKIAEDNNYKVTHHYPYDFPLKATQLFHTRRIHRIEVGCWRLSRQKIADFT